MSEEECLRPKAAGQGRLALIDAMRGLVLINMLVYHFLYDLIVLFGMKADWYWSWSGRLWQQMIVGSFIFISGFSSQLSRKNFRRGLMLLGCGVLLQLVTGLVMPDQIIRFGVLHFLGTAALLWSLGHRWINKIPAGLLLCGGILLFFLTWGTQYGYWGFGPLQLLQLPDSLYQSTWLFPFGLPGPEFYSSDYVPLLPWLFFYLAGTAAQRLVRTRPAVLRALSVRVPVLSYWGRKTLIVYLLHQPVLYLICLILTK